MRVAGRLRESPSIKRQHRFFAPLEEAEIRIRARYLVGEFPGDLLRLRVGKSSFPGAESHENQFVVLAALQLEDTAVGAVRNDSIPNIGQCDRLPQTSRVDRGEIVHQLTN